MKTLAKRIDGFESMQDGKGIGERNVEGKRLLELSDEKDLRVANT